MFRRIRMIAPMLLLPLFIAACGEKEDPEPVVEEAPPPTPPEIAAQIMQSTGSNEPVPPAGTALPPGAGEAYLGVLRGVYNQHNQTEDGKEALRIVARNLDQRLIQMEQRELWDFVIVMCDAHVLFNPGSTRFERSREKAIIELKKPRMTLTGIHNDTAFLEFYLPIERKTYKETLRVGEEMHGMKFKKIIGKSRGVEMEYLETREPVNVMIGTAGP